MTQLFCKNHVIAFFKSWKNSSQPLDLSLSDYFRSHKSLGSHDRRYIGETVYSLVRWKSLFDQVDPEDSTSQRIHLLEKQPIEEWAKERFLSEWAKRGTTPFLLQKLIDAYGPEEGRSLAEILNTPALITVRANLMKTTRETLIEKWTSKFQVRPGSRSLTAIHFAKREPLFTLPEFKEGLFEVQDEGSQLVAQLIQAKSGDRILDYCSGSGGKMLAVAPAMKGKGEIYLHDIRTNALKEAQKRLRRAGIQNAQTLEPGHPTLPKLYGKMDWVLADVPCSGTGTLRRNPDMKWKIDAPMIERLIEEQRSIIAKAVRYMKPTGKLVYATCSILPEENEQQIDYFLKNSPLVLDREPLRILPEQGGCDGFFAAVFRKAPI
jgi:16S rRNA C967 or C1407 C5-methylase (RsmB/RsmF family)